MDDWTLDIRVAGVSIRQEAVRCVRIGDWLACVAEPQNPHDRNAVGLWRVDARGRVLDGGHVGYVPRDTAMAIAYMLGDGWECWAHALEVTGGSDECPTTGLRVRLRRRRVAEKKG